MKKMMQDRRSFLKLTGLASAALAVPSFAGEAAQKFGQLIVPKAKGLKITGTFLDEISHDIPHQNWGVKEWNADFEYMKAIGIDTVIMIRCGHRRFITWPSEYLIGQGCYMPSVDLVDMFLRLAERHGMGFYFGLYDPGRGFGEYAEMNKFVIDEAWRKYGRYPTFRGWYISSEFSRRQAGCIEAVHAMGRQCKDVSNGLPTFISPYIDGKKAVSAFGGGLSKSAGVSVNDHEREWSEILDGIKDVVDICAFQDGHVDYHELDAFFAVNKRLCRKYGMQCWTNAENFDRDMPIKFLPIKFDKLRYKLEAAARAGLDKAITFEFSHFMSPQSCYPAAHNLYARYREYFGI